MTYPYTFILIALGLSTAGVMAGVAQSSNPLPEVPVHLRTPVNNTHIYNLEAPIPPQCYTQTDQRYNPCYTCHQAYPRLANTARYNQLDDGGLQGAYGFSEEGLTNHWQNLFVDRSDWVKRVSNSHIHAYIHQENYSALAPKLRQQNWQGYIPDLNGFEQAAGAFNAQGLALDGSHWITFNYKPFLGTFWPTNGSTDDVVIRLPKAFREHQGHYHLGVYLANLSLLELSIKQLPHISVAPLDETLFGQDLDGDGQLNQTQRLLPRSHYLGDASGIPISPQQYPEGTEFLHSVRYVGINAEGHAYVPPRMKELRYMKKIRRLDSYDISSRYARERKEKRLAELPAFNDHGQRGMENGYGWLLQGFIEDYKGELRPQTHEETLFCMGCHAAIGTTIDHTFAFARKITGRAGWGYINLRGMPDAPNLNEPGGEILNYLKRTGGGNEFRENPEMQARWFFANGQLNSPAVQKADVAQLITPSPARAHQLNKAYTHLVRHQSYRLGRDATLSPARHVFNEVNPETQPLPPQHQVLHWDIRLDWPNP